MITSKREKNICEKYSKYDENERVHLRKSVDCLIEKISNLPTSESADGQDYFQSYDVIRTIKEYCNVPTVLDAESEGR